MKNHQELRAVLVSTAVGVLAAVSMVACSGASERATTNQSDSARQTTSTQKPPGVPATTALAPSTEAPTTTTFIPRSFTIAATGDLLIHGAVAQRALAYSGGSGYDFDPMFDAVRPLLSAADLAICHMETPLSADNSSISGYPTFNVPYELADGAASAGYDRCSTASNHAMDRGLTGVTATLNRLDAVGITHTGTARDEQEAGAPPLVVVNGTTIAHISYTYGSNAGSSAGSGASGSAPWALNVIDPDTILRDAHAAREDGAEFVVLSLHWGTEYQHSPTAQQREIAARLLASPDVDLIIGHHAHVVQAAEKIGDKYVAYGLGNFLSNQSRSVGLPSGTEDGVIMTFTVTETEPHHLAVTAVSYTPTVVERPGYVIRPATDGFDPASRARTVAAITSLGPGAFDGVPTG